MVLLFTYNKLFFTPLHNKIKSLQEQNADLELKNRSLETINKNAGQRLGKRQKNLIEYQQLDKRLPQEPQFVEMIRLLNEAAAKARVTMGSVVYQQGEGFAAPKKSSAEEAADQSVQVSTGNNLTAQKPAGQTADTSGTAGKSTSAAKSSAPSYSGVSRLNFTVTVSGDYYQLLGFMLELEKASRLISVAACSLTAQPVKAAAVATPPPSSQTVAGSSSGEAAANLPPAPAAKGSRTADQKDSGPAVNAPAGEAPHIERAMDKYDMNHFQMTLQLSAFYEKVN